MFGFRYKIDWKKDNQDTRVLKILQYYQNREVNVWKLMNHSKVCHYCEIIRRLRKQGYNIVNRTEHKGKIMHSYYKLIK